MECAQAENALGCTCSYSPTCRRKGKCCECIEHHREAGELPACYFPSEVEATYDRSIARFVQLHQRGD